MPALAISRWILLRLLRSPWTALVGAGLLFGLPVLRDLDPGPSARPGVDLALAWAFPCALLGLGLALWTLAQGAEFLDRLDPVTRGVGEGCALAVAALYLQLPMLGGALLSGASLVDLGIPFLAILTTDLLLASVALLSLVPSFSPALRVSLFLGAVWALPALMATDPRLAPLVAWLDARAALRAPTALESLRVLPTALAVVLAAHLLRSAPAPRATG